MADNDQASEYDVLADAGIRVLRREAGRDYDPTTETPMLDHAIDAPKYDASTPDKVQGFYYATVGVDWEVPLETDAVWDLLPCYACPG